MTLLSKFWAKFSIVVFVLLLISGYFNFKQYSISEDLTILKTHIQDTNAVLLRDNQRIDSINKYLEEFIHSTTEVINTQVHDTIVKYKHDKILNSIPVLTSNEQFKLFTGNLPQTDSLRKAYDKAMKK